MIEGMKVFVAYAIGHSSNAVGCGLVYLPSDTSETTLKALEEDFVYYFSKLDGKHSETEAETFILHNYSDALEYIEDETMDYMADVISDYIENKEELAAIKDFNRKVHKGIAVTTKTVITFEGDVLC